MTQNDVNPNDVNPNDVNPNDVNPNDVDADAPPRRPGPLRRLYDWTLSLAERPTATRWLCGLSFAEASFFPIPPDVMLIPLCLGSTRRALRFATLCTLASIFGGMAGYAIGHYGWDAMDQFFFQWIPGFTPEQFERIKGMYEDWGVAVVFLAGFSPIPFKVFTIASGVLEMHFPSFVGAAAVGRAGRFFLVAGLLAKYGEPMKRFIDRRFNSVALAFSVLLVLGFAAIKLLVHR